MYGNDTGFSFLFGAAAGAAAIDAQTTKNEIDYNQPTLTAVANESAFLPEGVEGRYLNIQLFGESNTQYDLAVFGLTWCEAKGAWLCSQLLDVRVTCATAIGGLAGWAGPTTLFPALTHSITTNDTNAKKLEGLEATKAPGSICVDRHNFQRVAIRVNSLVTTKKADVGYRPYN